MKKDILPKAFVSQQFKVFNDLYQLKKRIIKKASARCHLYSMINKKNKIILKKIFQKILKKHYVMLPIRLVFLFIILKICEIKIDLTLTTQPHQKIRFLEIFFRILNMFAIVSNLRKKIFNFFRNPQK
jgi:hypothetical protein